MNRIRLFRLAATLAVPLTILAGAAIPAHASPAACDFHGCATTTQVNPDLWIRTKNPDKAKILEV